MGIGQNRDMFKTPIETKAAGLPTGNKAGTGPKAGSPLPPPPSKSVTMTEDQLRGIIRDEISKNSLLGKAAEFLSGGSDAKEVTTPTH